MKKPISYIIIHTFRTKRAGFPAQISPAGMSRFTMLPAPITAPSPIFTAFTMRVFIPMNTFLPITTFPA